jgi:hypothetical protein
MRLFCKPAIVASIILFVSPPLFGQIPKKMSYQGLLTTPGGSPVTDGSYNFEFALYDTLSGGILLWSETQAGVSVQQGIFTVMLGSVTPISPVLTKTAYLQITATGGPPGPSYPLTFSPRSELASAPYALAPWGQTGSDISYTTGNVGIGMASPSFRLDVNGIINATDIYEDGVPFPEAQVNGSRQATTSTTTAAGSVSGLQLPQSNWR